MRALISGMLIVFATTAHSNINIRFLEGAPKDRFIVENAGACDLSPFDVTFDLSKSKAGLIFDVTDQGAGVEVYQPMEVVEGNIHLTSFTVPIDGDSSLSMSLRGLPAKARVAFTIDVDDTLGRGPSGQIIVSGSEIAGAQVVLSQNGMTTETLFDETASTAVAIKDCTIG